ncbi:MAG: Sulfur carrier protein CysO [Myxococcota bacterium]|nr:Sulfur carrier protein CysO [Myxococcota bacterium]
MAVSVRVPTPLRKYTQGADVVQAAGSNVRELIDSLEKAHPGIKERLCDDKGEIRRFINIFVGGEDIRFMEGGATPVKDGDEVDIVPAIAGGR